MGERSVCALAADTTAPTMNPRPAPVADYGPWPGGEYDTKPAGRVSIENPPPNWLNIGWVLKDGWFAPVQIEIGLAGHS